jgi:hypothetical protein
MTVTSIGLGGQPKRFLGAYIKSISSSLGLSSNASSITVTLAEDPANGVVFQPVRPGTFVELDVGPTWHFGGIVQKYQVDVRNISGRLIQVTINDPRDAMRACPMIIAPGYSDITAQFEGHSGCSLLDVYGAYDDPVTGINLSGYTDAGMTYERIMQAIHGADVAFSNYTYTVPQQEVHIYGETYRFDTTELDGIVSPIHRFNSNLVTISDFIEDISKKHAFDWYVDSTRASDSGIEVSIRCIDRSEDNTDIDLATFLHDNRNRVISASSGLELRNDIACMVLQGAPVENMRKLEIKGLANEPIDLTLESGTNRYFMTETEMRVVLAGKQPWALWLGIGTDHGGGGGVSRYGGNLTNLVQASPINLARMVEMIASGNLPKNIRRDLPYLIGEDHEVFGKIYEKLKGHAESTYGKRWVHGSIMDDIIESAWTRGAVGGNDDPNEFFRQGDGRTRAYVEYNIDPQGGAFSLGLNNLTSLFGDTNIFKGVTVFGTNLRNVMPGESMTNSVLQLELKDRFNPNKHIINVDKSSYIYNNTSNPDPDTVRTKLWVAATVDKDGVIRIESPVLESTPTPAELLASAQNYAKAVRAGDEDPIEPTEIELEVDSGGFNYDPIEEVREFSTNPGEVWITDHLEGSTTGESSRRFTNPTVNDIIEFYGDENYNTNLSGADGLRNFAQYIHQRSVTLPYDHGGGVGTVPAGNQTAINILNAAADRLENPIKEQDGAAPDGGVDAPPVNPANPVPVTPGEDDREDADGNDEDLIQDSLLRVMRILGMSMFDMSARAYQPSYAYIPTRSRTVRYGPAFPSDFDADSEGRLEIIQDEGYCPWEFGSISAMQQAMQIKVDSASSRQRDVQTASIEVEGYPQFNLGDSLGKNSNITNIGINFGTDGVKTSYQLQSFTKKFGELTKEDIMLATMFRVGSGKRTMAQDQVGHMQNAMVSVFKNVGGRGYYPPSANNGGAHNFG